MDEHWLTELCDARPESQWHRQGPSIKGKCPFHSDTKDSFVVTPSKGIAKCFGCGRTYCNPLLLDAALRKIDFSAAVMHVRKAYRLKASIPDTLFERAKAFEIHRQRKYEWAELFCGQLIMAILAYPNLPPDLLYLKSTVEWIKARKVGWLASVENDSGKPPVCEADPPGVWSAICRNLVVGALPPLAVVSNYYKDKKDEAGYEYYRAYFAQTLGDAKWIGAMVLLYFGEPNSVCRFKLRLPIDDKTKAFLWVDDAFDADMGGFRGWFGLNFYSPYVGGKQEEGSEREYYLTAHMHEGEFDALASIARQILQGRDDYMALAAGFWKRVYSR